MIEGLFNALRQASPAIRTAMNRPMPESMPSSFPINRNTIFEYILPMFGNYLKSKRKKSGSILGGDVSGGSSETVQQKTLLGQ